jgi:hypothetical protein
VSNLIWQECDIFQFRSLWEQTHRHLLSTGTHSREDVLTIKLLSKMVGDEYLVAIFGFSNIKSLKVTHLFLQGGNIDANHCK